MGDLMGGVNNDTCDIQWHTYEDKTKIERIIFRGQLVYDCFKKVNLLTAEIREYIRSMEGDMLYKEF
jgi:hypothetical protein